MANKTKQETSAPKVPAVKPERAAVSPKFPLSRLRKDCLRLFGVTVSTFDGAAFGLTGRQVTVAEMQDRINKWQNTRVLPAKKKEAN